MAETITFSEEKKGWTNLVSYHPGLMCRLNNRFFTIKNGQLYLHNSESAPRMNFYGVQYKASIVKIINQEPKEDKIFKTIVTESDLPWKVSVKTNLTESSIDSSEFNKRESKWHGYIRRNENEQDLNSVSQGIGSIIEINGNDISFENISETISIGDNLYQLNGDIHEEVGTIDNIDDGIITISNVITAPTNGLFCFGKKDSRTNGSDIRGYYMEITLEDDTTGPNELFAVSSGVVKSYL